MANYLTTDTDLTAVANAIRTKGGTSAALAFPAGFVSAVQAIPTGITPTGTKQISITENGTTTEDVTNYASAEITVNVSGGGGGDIDAVIDGTIEAVESGVTTVRMRAFQGVTSLKTVSLTGAVSILSYAFSGCTGLTSFSAKNAIRINGYAFENVACDALVFPNITSEFGASALINFKGTKVDLGGTTFEIKTAAFSNANNMATLVLRRGTRVILGNIYAFNGTPFASGGTGGTLYVPSTLISSYQSATNWSTILGYANNQILPIEGSIYETQYADGTPIT